MRRGMMLGGAVVVAIGVGGCDTGVRNPATVPATNIAGDQAGDESAGGNAERRGIRVLPGEVEQLAEQRGVVILDVQPDSYYAQGYIAGSVHYNGQTPRDAFRAGVPPTTGIRPIRCIAWGLYRQRRLHANGEGGNQKSLQPRGRHSRMEEQRQAGGDARDAAGGDAECRGIHGCYGGGVRTTGQAGRGGGS